jgi:hypothetical protein
MHSNKQISDVKKELQEQINKHKEEREQIQRQKDKEIKNF